MRKVVNPINTDSRLAELNELFGEPPVLPHSENIAAYREMLRRFIECFEPQDFFETVLMKDVTDATWEAARCARHKVLLLDRRYRDRREAAVKRRKEWAAKKTELTKRIAAAKAEPATEPEITCWLTSATLSCSSRRRSSTTTVCSKQRSCIWRSWTRRR